MPLFIQQGRTLPRIGRRAQHGRRPQTLNSQRSQRPNPEASRLQRRNENYYVDNEVDLEPKVPTLTSQGRLPTKELRGDNTPRRQPGQGSYSPSATESVDSQDDNGITFPLPTRYKPSYTQARAAPRFSEFSVFASQKDKKKAKQVQRMAESEEALRKFLEEFPGETRFLAKLSQLEKYKQKLNSGDELLNSGESHWVYDVGRAVERRRVTIESKAFQEQSKAQTSSTSKKRKRKETPSSPSSYSTPIRPSTGGKTIPGYVVEESDENSDEEQDGQLRKRAQKTISGCDSSSISAFNVREALAKPSESEAEECSTGSSDGDESDGSSGEESDGDSSDESDEGDDEGDDESNEGESDEEGNEENGGEDTCNVDAGSELKVEPEPESKTEAEAEAETHDVVGGACDAPSRLHR